MSRPANVQHALRQHGARLLRFPDLAVATQADFGRPLTAIFIHGFTLNAEYMHDLMHQFNGSGFSTYAFEYPADRGIQCAAQVLRELLEDYDGQQALSRERVVLVCHSMGGLVGRALIAFEGGAKYVRKIITLGTPHAGTLRSGNLLRMLLSWGEHVSGLNPNAFSPKATSARELIHADSAPTLLSRLQAVVPDGNAVEYYSISGGLNRVEFGHGPARNTFANIYIQSQLDQPNDGLVQESSSNLAEGAFKACAPGCLHINSYAEYQYINHTYLVRNQSVAMKAVACARL